MHLLKVILDIGLLGYIHDNKTAARGVHRVNQYLFKGLLESGQCDLRFVATENLAGAHDLLSAHGLLPERVLKYDSGQLRSSRRGRRAVQWVHRHLYEPGFATRATRWALSGFGSWACAGEKNLSPKFLEGAEIYHSPLEAIPSAVLAHPRIRHFLTVHDLIPLTHPETVLGAGVEKLKKQIGSLGPNSFAFCVSETVRTDLLSLTALPSDHVFVTPLAADPAIFRPVTDKDVIASTCKKYSIPEEPFFLTLSAFDPRKNFGHIVHCFSKLVKAGECNDGNLVIVGSNPHRNPSVAAAIATHPQIERRIIMPGYIPDEDLAAIYSRAQAFLFPSLSEGFGIPPLEAMQCGTPVISSNTTSMPEVIGDAGLLLPPTDQDAWCQAILKVTGDAALRAKLSQRSLNRAKLFSWQRFIEATLAGYRLSLAQ